MAVFPTSFAMEMGGKFRQTLIDAEWNVATWPLSELASTTARDICGTAVSEGPYPGTYTGTGFTAGSDFAVVAPTAGWSTIRITARTPAC